jgi:geranylgeranyl pyrophosphate synthase
MVDRPPSLLEAVHRRYAALVSARLGEYGSGLDEGLRGPFDYMIRTGGKRFRPLLCLCAAQVAGGEPDLALPVACAVELIHLSSLLLDDLPCMDDAPLRRGQPTVHKTYDEATAILLSIAMLNKAYSLILESAPGAALLRRTLEIVGGCGMAAGQWHDLRGDDTIETVEKKTGGLIQLAVEAGLAVASPPAPEAVASALRAYGRLVGVAFQYVDDIVDGERANRAEAAALIERARAALRGLPRSEMLECLDEVALSVLRPLA